MDVFEGNCDEINVFVSIPTHVQHEEITPSGRNSTRFCLMELCFSSGAFCELSDEKKGWEAHEMI